MAHFMIVLTSGAQTTYDDASGFSINDAGVLVVNDHAAQRHFHFAPGAWLSVEEDLPRSAYVVPEIDTHTI